MKAHKRFLFCSKTLKGGAEMTWLESDAVNQQVVITW